MKKIIKSTVIVIGSYAVINAAFQAGKGYMLCCMRKNKLNVDEALKYVDYGSKNGPCKINHKIINFMAKQK